MLDGNWLGGRTTRGRVAEQPMRLTVAKAARRRVHGVEAIGQSVSSYYLTTEMANLAEAIDTMLDPEDGVVCHALSTAAMAAWLLEMAGRVNLRKYRQHPRGPKRPRPSESTILSALMSRSLEP